MEENSSCFHEISEAIASSECLKYLFDRPTRDAKLTRVSSGRRIDERVAKQAGFGTSLLGMKCRK